MTRSAKTPPKPPKPLRPPRRWLLQDAKARFSELVRRVRSEGPQHVTVRGRDEVVVVSAEEFRRLKGERSGGALIAAMQASPYRDIGVEPGRGPMPVRQVDLWRRAVTGWLLDTNILSELRRPKPEPKVLAFIAAQPASRRGFRGGVLSHGLS
jgi:prevent-host-death family protein